MKTTHCKSQNYKVNDQLLTSQAQRQPNTAREIRDLSSTITPAALPPTTITITFLRYRRVSYQNKYTLHINNDYYQE